MAEALASAVVSVLLSKLNEEIVQHGRRRSQESKDKEVWEEGENLYDLLLPLLGPPQGETTTRREEVINGYLRLLKGIRNTASAVGALALLWSSVVLLGGFVSDLRVKDFVFVTVLSFVMACKVVQTKNVFDKEMEIYLQEANIIHNIGGTEWYKAVAHLQNIRVKNAWIQFTAQKIVLLMVLVPKAILFISLGVCLVSSPAASIVLSVLRLARQDYIGPTGDTVKTAKLNTSLNIFYSLVVLQSLITWYYMAISGWLDMTVGQVAYLLPNKNFGYEGKVVRMYCLETERKFEKDGEVPDNWNLITYGVGLLQSASGDDHLWGARVLDQFYDKDISVRQELLSSRVSIQNLIRMIGWRGTGDNIESRERAARIFAHVASDLHVTHFPGTLECICSLLECYDEPQVACCPLENPGEKTLIDQHGSLQILSHNQDDAHMVVPINDQTGHEHVHKQDHKNRFIQTLAYKPIIWSLKIAKTELSKLHPKQGIKAARYRRRFFGPKYHHDYKSRGAKELVSQGMLILERLTQDKENCTEITKHQLLLSRVTAQLRSHDFLSNVQDDTMIGMLGKSLTVVSRLLTSPRDGATRLRQELASNTQAVSNLMGVLETDSKGAQQLHEQAVEILTALTLARFTKPVFGESTFMLDKFCENLEVFTEERAGETIAADETDIEEAQKRLRVKARDALQTLLPFQSASIVKAAANKTPKQDAIGMLTKLVDKTLSGKMGTTADAARRAGSSNSCAVQELGSQPPEPEEADSVQPSTQGNEEQSDERDINVISRQAFMEDMLFLAAAMRVINLTSEEDFTRPSPEDEALVKKVMEILEMNKRSTAELFRTLKVTYQVVIPMIQAVPSCIKYFNELNIKEALTEILKTMNGCDCERPSFDAARVKKMKERLSK